ncbi:MAG: preprotein translocase subunit SecE [Patescibacteria group bacterium]
MALKDYLKETREEMRHVSWPTRNQITAYTIVVIAISIATALYLGAFDYFLRILMEQLLK